MAEPTFGLTMVIEEQTVPGTPNAITVTGTLDETDGIVKRVAAGVNDSGLDFDVSRVFLETARNNLSANQSTFQRETFNLEVSLPWAGVRAAAPSVDADFVPEPGPLAVFKACGLTFTASGTPGQDIILGAPTLATVGLIGRNWYYVLYDVVGSATITYTPGEVPVFKASLQGLVSSITANNTFPTEDYATTSRQDEDAALVAGVAHVLGSSRDFSALEISIDNSTEDVPSANSATGSVARNTSRDIGLSMTILNNDQASQEIVLQQYLRGAVALTSQSFTVGDTAGNRIVHTFPKIEVRDLKSAIVGDKEAFELTGVLVNNGTEGDEFTAEMT